MNTLTSIIALLQVALVLVSNPVYSTDLTYKAQADSFIGQAMQLANKAILESQTAPLQVAQPTQNVAMGGTTVDVVQSIKKCTITSKDANNPDKWKSNISWSSDGLPKEIEGTVYGVIGNNAGIPVYSKFGSVSTASGSMSEISGSSSFKIVFDDGTTCSN